MRRVITVMLHHTEQEQRSRVGCIISCEGAADHTWDEEMERRADESNSRAEDMEMIRVCVCFWVFERGYGGF